MLDRTADLARVNASLRAEIQVRQETEAALRDSEATFRAMVETLPVAIYLSTGVEQKSEYLNPRFVALFGYTQAEVPTAAEWWPLAYPNENYRREIAAEWQRRVEHAIATTAAIAPIETVVTCKDGSQRTIAWNFITLGKKNYACGLDLTARKQAESEIRQLNAELERRVRDRTVQLEAANQELEAFSYSVSHDLRAPLRHVGGYVDLLNRRFPTALPEKGRHYLASIADAVRQMGTLIDDLLDFSRTGRMEMREANLDMNRMLQEEIAVLQPGLRDRRIEWVVAPLPSVHGDPAMLRLVWANLLGNAGKFTRQCAVARIEVGAREKGAEIVFFVRDNGVGFDMKYASKLFGVFQRMHPVEAFEGTGIGLANVRRIIQRHGGRTWAEASPGQGATFYFSMPIPPEAKP